MKPAIVGVSVLGAFVGSNVEGDTVGAGEGPLVGLVLGVYVKPATVGTSVDGEVDGLAVGVLLGA